MPISTITTQAELDLYTAELDAATTLYTGLMLATDANNAEQQAENQLLQAYNQELQRRIAEYNLAQDLKKQRSLELSIEKYAVTPALRYAWTLLFAAGIILQETLSLTTKILGIFLFPVHFVLDGIRSLWDIYRTARDASIAQRKTILGVSLIHIAGIIAAATVTALVISNPFALPVIFLGMNIAGLYKSSYMLHQTQKRIQETQKELDETAGELKLLKLTKGTYSAQNRSLYNALLLNAEAKNARLKEQLTGLKTTRFELRRETVIHALAITAVGLLLTSAVLSLLFPPAAAAVAMSGMLLYATILLTNLITSPAVRSKFFSATQWVKSKLGLGNTAKYSLLENNEALSIGPRSQSEEQPSEGNEVASASTAGTMTHNTVAGPPVASGPVAPLQEVRLGAPNFAVGSQAGATDIPGEKTGPSALVQNSVFNVVGTRIASNDLVAADITLNI